MNDATPTIEEYRNTPRNVGGSWARRLFLLLLALFRDRGPAQRVRAAPDSVPRAGPGGLAHRVQSVTGALLAISTIGLLTLALSYASFRVRRLRPLLEGTPLVLIDAGRVLTENLRQERITLEELESEARLAQLPSLDRVRWGILETNGKISFIPAAGGQVLVP